MERQAGLGRSLEEVIESLTPAERDVALTGGASGPYDVTPQFYRLVIDVQDLRTRVAQLEADLANGHGSKAKSGKKSKKKRNASASKKTEGKAAGKRAKSA